MQSLFKQLDLCQTRDRHRFSRVLRQLQREQRQSKQEQQKQEQPSEALLKKQADMEASIAQSVAKTKAKQAQFPTPQFNTDLPVNQARSEIEEAIAKHQVVILAGETGSGKTTQLPQILINMGYGAKGLIGHTQPRRIAARSVSQRIAEELSCQGTPFVGYKIRFQDQTSDDTAIKIMTDGILLAELQQDPFLSAYEVIIIDEAHERSLNIDFLMGILHTLLDKRPDLKVIITSATIETERFSEFFNQAPVLVVEGRSYPVDIRYREPLETDEEFDDVLDAIDDLVREGPGDILVFLSGERDIRELSEVLRRFFASQKQGTQEIPDIIPLYARLSAQEQNRVFQLQPRRRIILSTNVAETSLTVPGIRYVIDTGLVRISRYSHRTKVQRLPIEPISQASANQRAGRCGRVGPGICIRLYSENDFLQRPEYTDPEVLRTNLASVILQMAALRLGRIEQFPFIQMPDNRYIQDGMRLLEEVQAIETPEQRQRKSAKRNRRSGSRNHPKKSQETVALTLLGRRLSRLPVDPRLGAMVLAAEKHHSVREVLIIVAGLSIQDPRERPHEFQEKSDGYHSRFHVKGSDFISYLKLWNYIEGLKKKISGTQLRRRCKKEFLHFMRLREWQDLYQQLRQSAREIGLPLLEPQENADAIHRSLLAGLLSHVGLATEKHDYQGARQLKFFIFPGSSVFKAKPKWLMAAELVETSRLYARTVAAIQPEWLETEAKHLLKHSYHEPFYSKKQGAVLANEQASLYGLTLYANRKVQFGRIDPVLAREIYLRHALVTGDMRRVPAFVQENLKLIATIEEKEAKSRRRDLLIDEESLYFAYEKRIPADIYDDVRLQKWYKQLPEQDKASLIFTEQDLLATDDIDLAEQEYPEEWKQGNMRLPLEYKFEPGHEHDGVSVDIPLMALQQVEDIGFDWHIPALRHDRVTGLIRALPKSLRRNFVPAPDFARAVLDAVHAYQEPLLQAISYELRRMTGVTVELDEWDESKLEPHLRMNFRVFDAHNKCIAANRSLEALKQSLQEQSKQEVVESLDTSMEKEYLDTWDFGDFPQPVEKEQGVFVTTAYPALVDKGSYAALEVYTDAKEAGQAHKAGLVRLIYMQCSSPLSYLEKHLSSKSKLAMYFNPWGDVKRLVEDIAFAVIEHELEQHQWAGYRKLTTKQEFEQISTHVRGILSDASLELARTVEACLRYGFEIKKKLKGSMDLRTIESYQDIQQHVDALIYPGFIFEYGQARLGNIRRYLKAIEYRLDKLQADASRDRLNMQQYRRMASRWQSMMQPDEQTTISQEQWQELQDFRWWLEEYRVSLFASSIGTAFPVSEQRLKNQLNTIEKLAG